MSVEEEEVWCTLEKPGHNGRGGLTVRGRADLKSFCGQAHLCCSL